MKEAIQTLPFPVKGGAIDRLPALPENEKGIWQFENENLQIISRCDSLLRVT
jgi:hypothetical protein